MLLLAAVLVAAWSYGPRVGIMMTGRPFFLLPPSPSRYAEVALDVMQENGLYADSPQFRAARAQAEKVAADADDVSDVHDALEAASHAAGGKHSAWVRPDQVPSGAEGEGASDGGGDADGDAGGGSGSVAPTVESRPAGSGEVVWATVPENDMSDDGAAYADRLAGGLLDHSATACGAVVDLRGNRGGDLGPMIAGLNPLLPDGTLLTFEGPATHGEVTLKGSTASGGGTTITAGHVGTLDVPVVVLTDENTASSGEATLLAFRGVENVHVIGQPTAGAPSANQVITMPDGSRLQITVAGDRDRTGELHIEDPIAPDEETAPGAPTEQAAMTWLAAHGCG